MSVALCNWRIAPLPKQHFDHLAEIKATDHSVDPRNVLSSSYGAIFH
jgi:hypothetical protein